MIEYKAKIKGIEKVRHQATGTDFLEVTVDVITITEEGEEVVSTQKHALDPVITTDELVEVVEKIRAGWQLEQEQKEANKEDNAINENVYALQKELIDAEVVNGEVTK